LSAGGGRVPGVDLRAARRKNVLTLEQLSFRAGLSRPSISQLERDLKSPTVDTLFRICDALQASAADIVRRVDAARKRRVGP
jgi:transcriptional regulator with XRE-family HTH domain